MNGQELFFNTYMEQTSVSLKMGGQLGYEFEDGYEIGGFYQSESKILEPETNKLPTLREKKFFGVLLSGPILIRRGYNLKINARTGISNGTNFVITPSLISNLDIVKHIKLQTGLGIRALRPTFQLGLRFQL